jgi:WD40 repeat protein
VWKIIEKEGIKRCIKVGELEGHSETVEFVKFNFDGKLCITGGMNNVIKVWNVEENTDAGPEDAQFIFKLKTKLENGPSENDDILVAEWHPKGNAVLCGGKDFTLYLLNGATGDFLACFSGHEDDILCAKFTPNGGKMIVSSSADKTIRVWSPIKQDCLTVIK